VKQIAFVVAVALLVPGCSLFYWGFDATTYECQYLHNYCAAHRRHVAMARCALAEVKNARGKACSSPDYARGFVFGYADYLDLGGTGAPPPVPPSRYWKDCYSNPEGQRAMELWYAGYQDGIAAVCESGYRELEIVPSPHSADARCAAEAAIPPTDTASPADAPQPSTPEQIPRPKPSGPAALAPLPGAVRLSGAELPGRFRQESGVPADDVLQFASPREDVR
jgi:hypothetical protein